MTNEPASQDPPRKSPPERSWSPLLLTAVIGTVVIGLVAGGTAAWMVTRRLTGPQAIPLSAPAMNKIQFRAVLFQQPWPEPLTASTTTGSPTGGPSRSTPAPVPPTEITPTPTVRPTDASDLNWIDDRLARDFGELSACPHVPGSSPPPVSQPAVACNNGESYILGPAELTGTAIKGISVPDPPAPTGIFEEASLLITFAPAGARTFTSITARLATLPEPRSQLAIVVGDRVISAPRIMEAITTGTLEIPLGLTKAETLQTAQKLTSGEA